MKLHTLSLAALGLVASLSLAFAQDAPKPADPPALKAGILSATGAGDISLMASAKVDVTLEVAADGEVSLNLPATVKVTFENDKVTKEDVAAVPAQGRRPERPASITYKGFTKATFAMDAPQAGQRMQRVRATISGKGLTITATGSGRATIAGEGTYKIAEPGKDTFGAEQKWAAKPAAGARPSFISFGEQPANAGGRGNRRQPAEAAAAA